jgi:hypothetical protein
MIFESSTVILLLESVLHVDFAPAIPVVFRTSVGVRCDQACTCDAGWTPSTETAVVAITELATAWSSACRHPKLYKKVSLT